MTSKSQKRGCQSGARCGDCDSGVSTLRFYYLLSTHADRQGVDISVTVCFLFVCTVTDFSGEDKAIAASNFAGRFIGVQSRDLLFWGTLLPGSPKSAGESATAGTEL